ncbi:MAG: DUF4331 family protein [Fimbriimonadaceae bacterium]
MRNTTLVGLAALSAVLVGCNNGGGNSSQNGQIAVWATTSVNTRSAWEQVDRLARPVTNEVFATFANDRHKINNEISPVNDAEEIRQDIQKFMDEVFTYAGGKRSQATVDVIKAVLVPDVLKANLDSSANMAAYLGVETNGATGSTFGGRGLTDDVVDISLGIVFGTTVSALGLASPDGREIPTLVSDNVGAGGKQFTNIFPYLGAPR